MPDTTQLGLRNRPVVSALSSRPRGADRTVLAHRETTAVAAPRRARHCTYCPHPGADCCLRVHQDSGQHIYAHQICAAVRGVWPPLYVFLEDGVR